MNDDIEYWKINYEKAMAELEKAQSLLFEMSQRLRELEAKLLGGTTQ
jgi:uncharacterized protein YutE (UPF0331/DUF86 family)